ncbi:hypothetical protein GCM10025786_30390 [Nocardioides caeni]
MTIRRMQRKMRCLFKYGPRRCPHIERHSRRRTSPAHHRHVDEPDGPPLLRHALPVVPPAGAVRHPDPGRGSIIA